MIDPALRLRRAIRSNDLPLVKRIIDNNPSFLLNPDFDNRSQTSLHLAAELGFVEIASHLLDLGHDDKEISRDTAWDTPLTIAAKNGHAEVGQLLVRRCSRCIPWTNRRGLDALSISSRHADLSDLVLALLTHPKFPASVHARDKNGDTPLHHAAAFGSLKAMRILLEHGADPNATNAGNWLPLAYSLTVAAEVYFKNLIAEFDRRAQQQKVSTSMDGRESISSRDTWQSASSNSQQRQAGAFPPSQSIMTHMGVRLVTADNTPPRRPSLGRQASDPNIHQRFSPDERRRVMTPTTLRNGSTASESPEMVGRRRRGLSGN